MVQMRINHEEKRMTKKNTYKMIAAMSMLLLVGSVLSAGIASAAEKPNIVVIWGDDIGESNISAYSFGVMGYKTPNIDRLSKEGMMFTDMYADQSCTAGRSSFITGQATIRTGLSKVGMPGAPQGLQDADVTIATLLKKEGYATGQFGKNHLGDRNEYLPTV
ncbi:MAG: sulfatase-like hydrolase/transferase, partial [Arenicellales bacterium]